MHGVFFGHLSNNQLAQPSTCTRLKNNPSVLGKKITPWDHGINIFLKNNHIPQFRPGSQQLQITWAHSTPGGRGGGGGYTTASHSWAHPPPHARNMIWHPFLSLKLPSRSDCREFQRKVYGNMTNTKNLYCWSDRSEWKYVKIEIKSIKYSFALILSYFSCSKSFIRIRSSNLGNLGICQFMIDKSWIIWHKFE